MARIGKYSLTSQADGLGLALLVVEPEGEPVALVQLAHGMTEHKGRYLPFMKFLAEHGYACVINDHRGHGESVKSKGDLGFFYEGGSEGLVQDLHQVTLWFKARHPGKKLMLFGHSMGSLAVRVYRQKWENDIDGLVVCGSPGQNPAVGAGLVLNRAMTAVRGERHISSLFQNMTTGVFKKGLSKEESENAWLSTNQDNVISYDADPLCGFPFTLNGYKALLELMRDAYRHVPAVRCMREDGYRNVTSKMYPGMRHEILNHTEHQMVYDDLLEVFEGWRNRE